MIGKVIQASKHRSLSQRENVRRNEYKVVGERIPGRLDIQMYSWVG